MTGLEYFKTLIEFFWDLLNMHFSIYGIDLTFWNIAIGVFGITSVGTLFWNYFIDDER